jgi:uncharacterized membrane protein YbhN (UPF0104 family)
MEDARDGSSKTTDGPSQTPATPPDPGLRSSLGWLLHPYVRAAFKVALAAGILAFLFWKGMLDFSILKGVQFDGVAWAILTILPCFLIVSWRFQIILDALGLRAPFGRALQWTMIGEFFSSALPLATGGDLVKAVYAAQAYGKGRRGIAVLAVLLDRVVGLFGLFLFALLICLFGGTTITDNPRLSELTRVLIVVCGASVVAFLLAISPWVARSRWRQALVARLPWGDNLEKVYVGFAGMRQRPGKLALVLGLSLVNHTLWCSSLLVLARAVGLDFDILKGLVVIPLALFLNTFGFAGGFGVGEAAFEVLFHTMLLLPKGVGGGFAVAYHVLALLVRVVLGLPVYLIAGPARLHEDLKEVQGKDEDGEGGALGVAESAPPAHP